MKTKNNFLFTVLVVAFCFLGQTIIAATVAKQNLKTTQLSAAKSTLVCIQLKEIIIKPLDGINANGVLCMLVKTKKGLIPSIQLNEVNITASVFNKNNLVENSNNKLNEDTTVTGVANAGTNLLENNGYSLSTKKTYNRLLDFIVLQAKIMIRKIIPGIFC